jgi:hypothetical protein
VPPFLFAHGREVCYTLPMDFKEARNDPHRPSVMDPSEYVFVGAADDHGADSYLEIRSDVLKRYGIDGPTPWYDATEDGRPNYRCHHCGKHGSNIRYFVFFLHKPSKVVITVGQICAKKLNLGSKDELDLQSRAKAYRRAHQREIWGQHNPELFAVIDGGKDSNEFLASLYTALGRFGHLTPRQTCAVEKFAERQSDSKPFSAPASDKQVSFIKSLLAGREMASESRIKAEEQLAAGLTKDKASAWIKRLLELPKIEAAA